MDKVDLILTAETIVTMDSEYRIFNHGAIAIKDDTIIAVGPQADVQQHHSAGEIIDLGSRVIIPGLINAHSHVPMTLLRGLADDLRLDVWLMGYMMPVEREFVSPEFCRLGTQIACAEMIRGGVTCFADIYYFEDIVAQAAKEAGMRAICGQSILKFPTPDAESYEDSLAASRSFLEIWKVDPLIIPAIAPHSVYTCTEEILVACRDLAMEFDVPLHIHISETKGEVNDWRETYDMPVVPWAKKLNLFDAKVFAAHCVHIDDGEIHTLEHAGVGVAHNPSSNLKLASGFAPIIEMLDTGLQIGIGTDGTASNNDLDMFEEMRLASFIAKTVNSDPTALPAKNALDMATRMGAKALHIDHLTGSLEPGKRADLIAIDQDRTHNIPHFEREPQAVYSRLVYATKAADVQDVMVNGQWLMRECELLTIQEDDLFSQAAQYAAKIDSFLTDREGSVLSKLIAIGSAEQEKSYEVQIKVKLDDPQSAITKLEKDVFEIRRRAHYLEYDKYFRFNLPEEARLRYREDEFVNDEGEVYNVRSRLTLTGPAAEREYHNSVVLSRSRFIAPARYSPRFYREYFKPSGEISIQKDRLRWLIRFKELEFFINIDRILEPKVDGCFLEIKSRTWSRRDAEMKAELITTILKHLEIQDAEPVLQEYPDLIGEVI
ncbi:MAG: amidohydrolase [Anaerolineales bacterium]|nr:amidohydrolase [Anaerolineales bacterium]